jgi:hypothetical protein
LSESDQSFQGWVGIPPQQAWLPVLRVSLQWEQDPAMWIVVQEASVQSVCFSAPADTVREINLDFVMRISGEL